MMCEHSHGTALYPILNGKRTLTLTLKTVNAPKTDHFLKLLDRTSLKHICRFLLIKIKYHSMFKNINPFYKDISMM